MKPSKIKITANITLEEEATTLLFLSLSLNSANNSNILFKASCPYSQLPPIIIRQLPPKT